MHGARQHRYRGRSARRHPRAERLAEGSSRTDRTLPPVGAKMFARVTGVDWRSNGESPGEQQSTAMMLTAAITASARRLLLMVTGPGRRPGPARLGLWTLPRSKAPVQRR
jgi:hypothetical protein